MVSEEKIASFLNLQQIVLDIGDSTTLLEQFLPKVLQELTTLGYSYIFLSAVFIDSEQKINQTFFTDNNQSTHGEVTKGEYLFSGGKQSPTEGRGIFQKGSEWEMKVMYGEAAVVSDVSYLINSSYQQFSQIHSLLILPIQHSRNLSGVLILASSKVAGKVTAEEIEFAKMITRLIDLSFRLQDTESSLTKITQQVYQMNAKLHELDKLKDDFISVASHELRTPMTAIRSYAWMALHKSDIPLSEKMEKYLVRVLMSTERLIKLVNDMLNISRIESQRIEIKPEPIDMILLCKDIIDEVYYSKSTEKQVQMILEEQKIPKVFADSEKLREVLINLVGNALKFTALGKKITISFFTDGKVLETFVKDEGVGISKDDLGKLFKKFARLDNSYSMIATSGGTGLGLYICKSLIELMGGRIWVSSEGLGKGSTFAFSLPVVTQEVLKNADKYTFKPPPGFEAKPLEPVAI